MITPRPSLVSVIKLVPFCPFNERPLTGRIDDPPAQNHLWKSEYPFEIPPHQSPRTNFTYFVRMAQVQVQTIMTVWLPARVPFNKGPKAGKRNDVMADGSGTRSFMTAGKCWEEKIQSFRCKSLGEKRTTVACAVDISKTFHFPRQINFTPQSVSLAFPIGDLHEKLLGTKEN